MISKSMNFLYTRVNLAFRKPFPEFNQQIMLRSGVIKIAQDEKLCK